MSLRVILDGPRGAAENMAVDEALLESVRSGLEPSTLRVYTWDSPAYTVGYFQDPAMLSGRGLPVVKRPTGGGAVLHGRDVTFSLVLKDPNPWLPANVKESYLKVNMVLLKALRPLFPGIDFSECREAPGPKAQRESVCFDSPSCYDLMLRGKKVVGSSQRRSRGAILHQCSIFLEAEPGRIAQDLGECFARELSFLS